MAKNVLFIGHDAYRAGAQIALIHILRWLRANCDANLFMLLKLGGELATEYRKIAPTRVLRGRELCKAVGQYPVDLVYANTVAALDVLKEVKEIWECPVICHVHELEMSLRRFCGLESFKDAQQYIDAYIAASDAVKTNLVRNHNIDGARVYRVYSSVAAIDSAEAMVQEARVEIRKELGIGAGAFIVGGCGTTDWRKAPDMFVQIAAGVKKAEPARQIHFVWVGGDESEPEWDRLRYDVERLDVGGFVHFVGPRRDPKRWFATFDVFLLTSREDSFPLVCLEAASLGVPIICFQGAGGMPEFVEDDAGFVVPYLSGTDAADRILTLVREENVRIKLGTRAAEKVKANHDIDVVGRQILEVLKKYW